MSNSRKKDAFDNISKYIKLLYEYCKEAGIYLDILKIEQTNYIDESEKAAYEIETLMWSCAETYEIMESLREGSKYYKDDRITKNDIIDMKIDWGLQELEREKKQSKGSKKAKRKKEKK